MGNKQVFSCKFLVKSGAEKQVVIFSVRNIYLSEDLMLNFDRMNIQKLYWVNEKSFVMEVTQREKMEPNGNYEYGKKRKYYMKVNLL